MAHVDTLPPLREVIQKYGLDARKSLGQNFLLDLNLTTRIARSAGPLTECTVLEVGPGPGGLTRAILALGARDVVAIEKDARCLGALEEIAHAYPKRLKVLNQDALGMGADGLPQRPVKIIANLPYNVATPLLIGWLSCDPWPPWWQSMTLMFQKEVADRMCAQPGDKAYGRLAVIVGWRTVAGKVFDISPKAFSPPPKVTSTVVHLVPREKPTPCSVNDLERVTAAAFGQRRKMLRASLKSLSVDTNRLIRECGLRETARAEEIPVEGFVKLARAYADQRAGG
ncbi:MAG: 16S rRNA (adenine(1518)-N(6)/adenine(1519)-N(6))-dimethyltransferase RsmA [Stappiaceae bacterium]